MIVLPLHIFIFSCWILVIAGPNSAGVMDDFPTSQSCVDTGNSMLKLYPAGTKTRCIFRQKTVVANTDNEPHP